MDKLSIASFNCRNIKSSVDEIQGLCGKHDIILLQETWLLDFELPFLSSIHDDFYGKGIATVTTGDAPLTGRPHGGLGVLWNKKLGNVCNILDTHDTRIMGIEIKTAQDKIVLYNVYLPYCCDGNSDEFLYYLTKLDVLLKDCDSPYVFTIGDFNADTTVNTTHKFGTELLKFCEGERYMLSDVVKCYTDTFTYFSEAHQTTSWILEEIHLSNVVEE